MTLRGAGITGLDSTGDASANIQLEFFVNETATSQESLTN